MMHGVVTALVTPFKNGMVDEDKFREHVEWQIQEGVHALLPCGTTGESSTLDFEEHENVIRICIEQANKRVPVIAGVGSNNTQEAISLTKFAKEAGADAALHITPYYNKPSQEGLYQHFKAIHDAVEIPIYAYNVPGRTGVNMLPATIARIHRDMPRVLGTKEAAGDIVQLSDIIEYSGKDMQLFTGDDFNFLPALSVGAVGVVSVTSNVCPKLMVELYNAFVAKDLEKAKELHFALQNVHRHMFIDVNPVPVKTALSLMGRMSDEFKLPLCPTTAEKVQAIKEALIKIGIKL